MIPANDPVCTIVPFASTTSGANVELILVVVQRWDNVVTSGIVVQYVKLASGNLGDAFVQFAYRFLVREFEGQIGDLRVWRRVLGRIADGP
jgi:hypothetical protein